MQYWLVTTLRERKKQATRVALREAALRLALQRGPEQVRVDDIAEAAGVSPRTYNNYYPSREHAIVAAVTAQRGSRIAAAIIERPTEVDLATAVIDAIAGQYSDPSAATPETMMMITNTPALRACYVETVTSIEEALTDAITARRPDVGRDAAEVLAVAVEAAAKLALQRWLQATSTRQQGFVVPSGNLPELVRTAAEHLRPALDAAARKG